MRTEQFGYHYGSYEDHVYKWNVLAENNETEEEVIAWCRKNLKDAENEYADWMNKKFDDEGIYFGGYYELNKVYKQKNMYFYEVCIPYCD